MKKVLLAILCLASLSSCSVKIPYVQEAYFTDYRIFMEKGFFITESDAVSFDYDAVGSMAIEQRAGHELILKKGDNFDSTYSSGLLEKKWGKYKNVSLEGAMDYFYSEAKKKGADGTIKFKVETIFEGRTSGGMVVNTPVGYTISGMLIKIRQ